MENKEGEKEQEAQEEDDGNKDDEGDKEAVKSLTIYWWLAFILHFT